MTTHRERVRAALRGEVVDRPAVAMWRHFPADDQDPALLAAAHLAFQHLYDFDLVKVTPASSFSVRDWGVEDAWQGNPEGTRTYTRYAIRTAEDWEKLQVLDAQAPALARQLECIRIVREALSGETPILQTIFNPLSQAKHLAGKETLQKHLQNHRGSVEAGLGVIRRSTANFIEAAAAEGIDGIFYAVQHAQAAAMSQEEFSDLSRDDDVVLLGAAAGMWCNMLHVHGERIHLDAVRDYPAHILNWHDREMNPSMEDAVKVWPGALCGGISRESLVDGTVADVAREASESLGAPWGRRVILSTGCVVPLTAPHAHLLAARAAAETARHTHR